MHIKQLKNILLVDDMAVMRKIYKKVLTEMGFENFFEADDGIPAWKIIEEQEQKNRPIEFIVSDWNMPGMQGIDLLKKVRGNKQHKDIPFLMVTAENEPNNIKIALQAGVNNFVAKPFKPEDFKNRIISIFNKL